MRFLVNLLSTVADKVHRDQRRLADMRGNLVRTQKELKRLRELVLETVETPLSAPVHDTLDKLITTNRRVNYRVEPPPALAATLRLDSHRADPGHLTHAHHVNSPATARDGSWITGVAISQAPRFRSPVASRMSGKKVTLELDLAIDEFAALSRATSRAQLLDILC